MWLMSSMFFSCDITVTLGLINLGGATVIGTLCYFNVIVTLRGTTIGTSLGLNFVLGLFVCYGCILLNRVANLSMACNWLYLVAKGVLGPEFLIICIISLDALVVFSVVYNPGMMICCGKNFSASAGLPPLYLVYSNYITNSDTLMVRCTILVFRGVPKFYVVVFSVY